MTRRKLVVKLTLVKVNNAGSFLSIREIADRVTSNSLYAPRNNISEPLRGQYKI